MLRFRDLSLRKRLLLANFMMVAVPVLLLSLAGGLLLSAFRYSGTTQKDILTALKRVGTYRTIRGKFPASPC